MRTAKLLAALLSVFAATACTPGSDSSSECDGKCDGLDLPEEDVPESPCDGVMFDHSGRGFGTGKIAGRLNDPIARLVFRSGEGCPTTLSAIMDKLKKAEATDQVSCDTDGRRTMFVSETAQVMGTPTNYRGVTAVDCEQTVPEGDDGTIVPPGFGSQVPGVLFSTFGIDPQRGLPENVELIAFDKAQGIFNFYETDGRRVNFFGTSKDMLAGPGSNDDRRCAACHNAGGLVMKELDSPWMHWEGDTDTPGTQELVDANEEIFGSLSDGIDMEDLTRAGNTAWNGTRLSVLRESASTRDILRPLFCGDEINLGNASSSPGDSTRGEVSFLPLGGAVMSDRIGFGSFSNLSADQYDAVLRANGQTLKGLPTENIETHFGLAHVVPGRIGEDYIDRLVEEGIVSDELIGDVLAVDLTRAVFSTDRCGLVDFVPTLKKDDLTSENVVAGLIENLEAASPAAGSPAAELLRNLQDEDPSFASSAADAFEQACNARTDTQTVNFERDGSAESLSVPGFVVDYMRYISLLRDQARTLRVMEFPQTLPDDNLRVDPATRFDPNTCELTKQFVSVEPPAQG